MYNENELFSRWAAEMYDIDETGTQDTELILRLLGDAPQNVLEVACGSGRILVALARAGHKAAGFDIDGAMLDRIATKADGLANISWRRADALADDWGTGYDAVLLAGNLLFNLVSDMEYGRAQATLIRKAAQALRPGGHVFIDYGYTLHPENWFEGDGERVIWQGTDSAGCTGTMSLLDNTYDRATGTARFVRRFVLTLADGTVVRQDIPSQKHFATLKEIQGWLAQGELTVEQAYGSYDLAPIGEGTSRAILWARKG